MLLSVGERGGFAGAMPTQRIENPSKIFMVFLRVAELVERCDDISRGVRGEPAPSRPNADGAAGELTRVRQ